MTRTPISRQLLIRLRDTQGHFVNVRATLAEMARYQHPRPRRRKLVPTGGEQLVLF